MNVKVLKILWVVYVLQVMLSGEIDVIEYDTYAAQFGHQVCYALSFGLQHAVVYFRLFYI